MAKKSAAAKTPRSPKKNEKTKSSRARIANTIAELDRLKPVSAKAAKAIALFKSWLADESGYDEKVWPRLKKALDRERERAGARSLFNG